MIQTSFASERRSFAVSLASELPADEPKIVTCGNLPIALRN
jgi:hypothetical protein